MHGRRRKTMHGRRREKKHGRRRKTMHGRRREKKHGRRHKTMHGRRRIAMRERLGKAAFSPGLQLRPFSHDPLEFAVDLILTHLDHDGSAVGAVVGVVQLQQLPDECPGFFFREPAVPFDGCLAGHGSDL